MGKSCGKFYNGLHKRLQELEWVNSRKLSLFYVSREDEKNNVMNTGVEENDAIMLMGQFSRKYALYMLGKEKPPGFRREGICRI